MNAEKIIYIFLIAFFVFCVIFIQCSTTQTSSGEYEYIPPEKAEELNPKSEEEPSETKKGVPITSDVPAVKPKTESIFTVQIFASESKELSEQEAEKIRSKVIQPVLIRHVDGYYKVQVGNYSERREAERVKDKIKNLGYIDSFIVYNQQTRFFRENVSQTDALSEYFSVQILASQNREEARQVLKNTIDLKFNEAYIIFENNLWKVRVGKYNTKQQAKNCLNKLKNIGFVDSWIVLSKK